MSIRALNWATQTYVGDAMAKSLLRAIADYADETGAGFPSLSQLAEDCDMSIDSVRRRLRQLEELGLCVVFQCWMDEHGKRNHEKRGRQTSSDIKLLLTVVRTRATVAQAEQLADTAETDGADADTPLANSQGGLANGEGSQQQGAGSQSARAGVALGQPPYEPSSNQESPLAPQVGGASASIDGVKEPEHWAEFWQGYPGHEVMRRDMALTVFVALTEAERLHARAAVPLLADQLKRLERKPRNAHSWLKDKGFLEFPGAKLPEKPPEPAWIEQNSEEWRALGVLAAIVQRSPPQPVRRDDGAFGMQRAAPVSADLRSLAAFNPAEQREWHVVEPDTREYCAWRERIHAWTGQWVEPEVVFLPGEKIIVINGENRAIRNRKLGLRVPTPWPPKKDGTLYRDQPGAAGANRNAPEQGERSEAVANGANRNVA